MIIHTFGICGIMSIFNTIVHLEEVHSNHLPVHVPYSSLIFQ